MSFSMPKTRVDLPLEYKVEIIRNNDGVSQRKLAAKYGISKSQVWQLLKRKAEILESYRTCPGSSKRPGTKSNFEDINNLTWEWYQQVRSLDIQISGPMIQTRAKEFAEQLGRLEFKASNGWLNRFKIRHGIMKSDQDSAAKSSPSGEELDFWQVRLQAMVRGYRPPNVYTAQEFGLFFRAMPDHSLNFGTLGQNSEQISLGLDRLAVWIVCNMSGEFERTWVVGQAKPDCYKNKSEGLPVLFHSNQDALINSIMFTEWLQAFDNRMRQQNRHVILFLKNDVFHISDIQLTNTKVVYIPQENKPTSHPLEQGVIKAIKTRYRKRLLSSLITQINSDKTVLDLMKDLDVSDAVCWISAAINDLKPEFIRKCFIKSGFQPSSNVNEAEEDQELFELMTLVQLFSTMTAMPAAMTAAEYTSIDEAVPGLNFVPTEPETQPETEPAVFSDLMETDVKVKEEFGTQASSAIPTLNDTEAVKSIRDLRQFAIRKDDPVLLNLLSSVEDHVLSRNVSDKLASFENSCY